MTSNEAVVEQDPQDVGPDTNAMPKVTDASKLPTIPAALPQAVQEYASTSARGRIQVKHANAFLESLQEFGSVILSQHHAEGAAELELEESNDPSITAVREQLDAKEADVEKYRKAYESLQEEFDKAREKAIADIVASKSGDVNYEEASEEYATTLSALTGTAKNYVSAGEKVHAAFKDFLKSIPSVENLVEGKKKGARSNSTMPGRESNSSQGWKPSFAWLEVKRPTDDDFVRLEGVTSIGTLAKVLDGTGRTYESILENLKSQCGGKNEILDDHVYTWFRKVQNEDDDTETTTYFRGMALSRGAKNARANEAAAKLAQSQSQSPQAQAQANPSVEDGDSSEGDAAVNF